MFLKASIIQKIKKIDLNEADKVVDVDNKSENDDQLEDAEVLENADSNDLADYQPKYDSDVLSAHFIISDQKNLIQKNSIDEPNNSDYSDDELQVKIIEDGQRINGSDETEEEPDSGDELQQDISIDYQEVNDSDETEGQIEPSENEDEKFVVVECDDCGQEELKRLIEMQLYAENDDSEVNEQKLDVDRQKIAEIFGLENEEPVDDDLESLKIPVDVPIENIYYDLDSDDNENTDKNVLMDSSLKIILIEDDQNSKGSQEMQYFRWKLMRIENLVIVSLELLVALSLFLLVCHCLILATNISGKVRFFYFKPKDSYNPKKPLIDI